MIGYEELKRINAQIVAEALKDLDLKVREKEKLDRIAQVCTVHVAKNEALKKRLTHDANYQLRCQALDARSQPLREILRIVREGEQA